MSMNSLLKSAYQVHSYQLPGPSVDQFTSVSNIGTIAFDTHEELLWVGDNSVRSPIITRLLLAPSH